MDEQLMMNSYIHMQIQVTYFHCRDLNPGPPRYQADTNGAILAWIILEWFKNVLQIIKTKKV